MWSLLVGQPVSLSTVSKLGFLMYEETSKAGPGSAAETDQLLLWGARPIWLKVKGQTVKDTVKHWQRAKLFRALLAMVRSLVFILKEKKSSWYIMSKGVT